MTRSLRTPLALVLAASALAGCASTMARPIAPSQITAIGVNAYLWRAALDTLAAMPLTQTDSAGGVIVTDWYGNPANPNERVKLTVAILDTDLRADAVQVTGVRQVSTNGTWTNAPLAAATVQKLEEVILTRARDIRRSAVG